MKGIIKVKVETCMACNRCQQACRLEHSQSKNILEAIYEEKTPWSNLSLRKVGVMAVPTSCRQCAAAVCMAVCPTGALHRDGPGEPVLVDGDRCVGCESCVLVRPFGVPKMTPDHSNIEKCDQCYDRVKAGKLPACVEACPTGSLKFIVTDEDEEVRNELSFNDLYQRVREAQQ